MRAQCLPAVGAERKRVPARWAPGGARRSAQGTSSRGGISAANDAGQSHWVTLLSTATEIKLGRCLTRACAFCGRSYQVMMTREIVFQLSIGVCDIVWGW